MADFVLTLGGVGFQDFEVPDSVRAGGAQARFVHKYPGGSRTIDTTGADDAPVTWSGWFEGPNAQARCQAIDIMRRAGSPVVLTWSAYSYLVVIAEFKWDFRRYYHIGYTLSLEVIQDQTNPLPQAPESADEQINSDATDASNDVAALSALSAPSGQMVPLP